MKKYLFILSIFLALALILGGGNGCATGDVKKDQVLIPLTDKIYMEEHDQRGRSYHIEIDSAQQLQLFAMEIFELNGVQDVAMFPYQIVVKKSPLFKWEDIEPEVIKILKR